MIKAYSCVDKYIKRVLRDVHNDPNDIYIYHKLVSIISAMIIEKSGGDTSEKSIILAVAKMENPSKLGRKLRADYKAEENGIMLFNRTLVNLAVPAFFLASAFVVFRLYPTTEYVAYAIIAVVTGLSAYFSYRCFYKLRYSVLAVVLPIFLFIFYPVRDALKKEGNFFSNLFSYSNHIILIVILIILIIFPSVALVLYAREYTPVRQKKYYTAVLSGALALLIALFVLYAYHLKTYYDYEAKILIEKINCLYSLYNKKEPPDSELVITVETAEELELKYSDIYIPRDKQTSGSLSKLLECFSLYSRNYSYLVRYFHPQFDPKDEQRMFDVMALEQYIQFTFNSTASALEKAAINPSFRALVSLESDCRYIFNSLSIYISRAYNDWIFSSK